MSTPGVSPPFMLGTSASFTGGGTGTANDTLSLMNSIRTQDMSVTQQRWLRASRSMAFYAGSPSGSRYSNQAGPGFGRSDLGYSFNEINAKMNSIIGRQIQHRKSLSCQSALPKYNNVANKFSKVFSYCESKMSLPEKRSKGFEKGVGSGLAIAELYFNR